MALIDPVYFGTYLARPAQIITRPDLIDSDAYMLSNGNSGDDTLRNNTLIALPHGPEYPLAQSTPIDTATIYFLDLTAVPARAPLPVFPNLRAVYIGQDSDFVPAPIVIHRVNAVAGTEWGIKRALIPNYYNLRPHECIKRVVFIVRAESGTDLEGSTLDLHEWNDMISELSKKTVAKGTMPCDKKEEKRMLQLALRIIVASPSPTPAPPNLNHSYSALAQLGTIIGSDLPDLELLLDGPEQWDLNWLGYNYFAQQGSYFAAYHGITTMVGFTKSQSWDMMFVDVGHDVWINRALQSHLKPLPLGEYECLARRDGIWEFEDSRQ
ncbi:hypothetical protein CspeluHIS016_0101720 [Cutaneotrichosporon spelunceum]|uniref:Uncharacterized protein n=1 Tax=Cutaneotrichosporon spelunceum TaxID=1672016 RepID=A0AAD3Y7L7_9TREE|nr:hypothetical protein CspeluHIS016_0101720 [Cutaneotrichosporon spelunceum]